MEYESTISYLLEELDMGIFKRLKDLAFANINDAIDKAEDPEKMLEQFLRDMEEDILDAERAVAQQIASEKNLEQQVTSLKSLIDKRQEQAEKAIDAGNDELARKALQDKKDQTANLEAIQPSYDTAKKSADQLRAKLTEMKQEYEKMKNQKTVLQARAQAAKAQKQINQAMSGIGVDNGAKGFDRMNRKVLEMEAQAQASEELAGSNKSLDDEFAALDADSVDDELAALKAKRNQKSE